MRVAPIGLFGERTFDLGCQSCAITHGHPSGYLAGGAFAVIIEHVLRRQSGAAGDREGARAVRPRAQRRGTRERSTARCRPLPPRRAVAETVESLGGGWVAEEALAIAIYCALVAHDFADGVVLAVNHGGDSDSTGAHGRQPARRGVGRRGDPCRRGCSSSSSARRSRWSPTISPRHAAASRPTSLATRRTRSRLLLNRGTARVPRPGTRDRRCGRR